METEQLSGQLVLDPTGICLLPLSHASNCEVWTELLGALKDLNDLK